MNLWSFIKHSGSHIIHWFLYKTTPNLFCKLTGTVGFFHPWMPLLDKVCHLLVCIAVVNPHQFPIGCICRRFPHTKLFRRASQIVLPTSFSYKLRKGQSPTTIPPDWQKTPTVRWMCRFLSAYRLGLASMVDPPAMSFRVNEHLPLSRPVSCRMFFS